jgi:hypothetical protein
MPAETPMLKRYVHKTKQRFAFYEFVRAKYTDSKLNDTDFAKMASVQLNFPCTAYQVAGARRDFTLPTNTPQFLSNPAGINGSLAIRVARIEAWLDGFDTGWRVVKK